MDFINVIREKYPNNAIKFYVDAGEFILFKMSSEKEVPKVDFAGFSVKLNKTDNSLEELSLTDEWPYKKYYNDHSKRVYVDTTEEFLMSM